MRILLMTETVPYPLDTGGRIKTWHTLGALAREHDVHCHAFVRSRDQGDRAAGPLGEVCASVALHLVPRSPVREATYLARAVATGQPYTVVRHYSPRVARLVAEQCRDRRIDVVYCDHLSMLEYGRRLPLPIVHDAHNVEHRLVERFARGLRVVDPRRPIFAREARWLRAYEQTQYRTCALVFAVSDIDRAEIAALAPDVPIVSVPIAVAASAIVPVDSVVDAPEVLFVGAQDWPPNAEAVEFFLAGAWPLVRRQVPDARITVVGRGEARAKARWSADPSIRFTGWVDDVEPWFRQSRVMVVPLRSGSGMRVKILDAFARGVPVVTTTVGLEGIEAGDGREALVADTAAALADATTRLLRDRGLAERLARAARALVLARHDTGVVGSRQLDALRLLADRQSTDGNRVIRQST